VSLYASQRINGLIWNLKLEVLPSITFKGNSANSALSAALAQAFSDGIEKRHQISESVVAMPGMSGQSYRRMINSLIQQLPDARYMEIGSWAGSTLCSAISSNQVTALAIDNWSEFGGPTALFFENLSKAVSKDTHVSVLSRDFRLVNYEEVGKFNVYLFDGPHAEQDQHDALILAMPALDDEFIFIVDDWNWNWVRDGTTSALKASGLEEVFSIELRTTLDNIDVKTHGLPADENSEWHNGYYFTVLRK
jgi:hypothetical protein